MTGLHAALAAWIRHGEAVPADVTTYDRSIVHEGLRALLAEYEPTPSDQALRDLRAGVEALADEWDRYAAMTDESGKEGRSVATVRRTSAVRLMHLLASTAPATASEGEPCGKCEWDGYGPNGCEHATASEGVEGTTEPGRNSSASEGATEPGICLWANQICEQPNHHGCLTCTTTADRDAAAGVTSSDAATEPPSGLQVPTDAATPVTSSDGDRPRLCCPSIIGAPHDQDCEHHETTPTASSDGDRGLGEEERRSLGCQCTRLDDVWHHARLCPVPAVERIIAARVDEAVGAALIVGATRSQPESTERVEWGVGCMLGNVPHVGKAWTSKRDAEESADRLRAIWRSGHAAESAIDTIHVVRRTVTTYAPVVGPWEPVGEEQP